MADFDIVVRGGTVATASDITVCDVGVKDGRITALGASLGAGAREIDADGKYVLPGGIDSHVHIEQKASVGEGVLAADDFYTGTRSAAFGGNTTIIPFAAQYKGQSLRQVVQDYHELAGPKAVIDYAFHLIVSDPSEQVLGQELPALIKDGYTSFKVYMTYDSLQLDDYQMLQVMEVARREGAMMMVHAENYDVIRWLTNKLTAKGHTQPRYHAISHARLAEGEATNRAIHLAELIDVPVLIVHVSEQRAMERILWARNRAMRVYGETCPQYLFLTADDLDRPGTEGAKFCCSPPPRDTESQEAVWRGLQNGTFQVFSSDHAPYRYDETGKLAHGPNPSFKQIPNGLPGIELRMPLLFSEGVLKGRIDLNRFVELTSTNAAKLYGLYPRKGTIVVGADADFAIWDPEETRTVTWDILHDNVGYTPYEGREITGWPVLVASRGRIVVEDGELNAERGSGDFLRCALPEPARPLEQPVPEMDPASNFGAHLLD